GAGNGAKGTVATATPPLVEHDRARLRRSYPAPPRAEARRLRRAGCTWCPSMAVPAQRAEPHPLIIDAYLQVLLEQAASDLILTAGAPPNMRKDGALV